MSDSITYFLSAIKYICCILLSIVSRSLIFVKFYEGQLQPLSIFSLVWLPTCIFRSTYYIEKKTTYLVAQQGCFLICFTLFWIEFIYMGQNTFLVCVSKIFYWIVEHCLFLGNYQVQLSFWDSLLTSKAMPAHLRSSSSAGYCKRTWLSNIMFVLIPLQ